MLEVLPERTLAYVTHSGFGHQYQSLLRGLFLAVLSNRTLIVPPLMGHKEGANIDGSKGCAGKGQSWEYHVKTRVLQTSNEALAKRCVRGGDSFFQLFNFHGLPALDGGCGVVANRTSVRIPCPDRVDETLTMYLPLNGTGRGTCDQPRPCGELVTRLSNGVIGPHISPKPSLFARTLPPRDHGTHCLGPINEYFVRGLMGACTASHALVGELQRRGLPLRRSVIRSLVALMPQLPPGESCTCVYTRLPDHDTPGVYKRVNTSVELLLTSLRKSNSLPKALHPSVVPPGPHTLEIVSNCFPMEACEEALRSEYSAEAVAFPAHADAQRHVASVLGMTKGNAKMVYDIVRCARCSNRLHVAKPQDGGSSFFEAIGLLHARWHH